MPQGAAAQQQAERAMAFLSIGRRPPSVSRVTPAMENPVLGPGYISSDFDIVRAAVYLTDYSAGTLTVFSTSGKVTEQITGLSFPEGITGDTKGNIYVANAGMSGIKVYDTGSLKHLKHTATIADPGYFPSDVSFQKKTGILGVTNIESTSAGAGSVRFFSKHGAQCATVTDPKWAAMYFGAFDAAGNFYIDGLDANGSPMVGVVTGDCHATKVTTLGGVKLAFPGGIKVAPNGRILIDDQGSGNGSTIYTYEPPVNNTFGKPVFQTALQSGNAVSISLNEAATHVFEADSVALDAQMFAYPQGGSPLKNKFRPPGAQLPIGVYVSPPEVP